ncbi:MAG TPA: 16S rRNA (cytidine(1402)-2'-O)-methyltransferase [Gammaproteobacteria bacterium]|nr:16S rRNA (cytidine(1402)-2'-O)-methyltransferase [Gammaproteobacteria bacterium]
MKQLAEPENVASGVLYVVATPIGHLDDITIRAIDILKQVDYIAAEDTRHSKKLLDHYQITTPSLSLHEHNEAARIPALLEKLQQGEQLALISDAGTPLMSDPGFLLVRAAREAEIPVIPIPGPSALIAAASAAGIAVNQFCFLGFLPHQPVARRKLMEKYGSIECTMIVYESPHRLCATLEDLNQVMGDARNICIAREMTKKFETFLYGTAAAVRQQILSDTNQLKGEMVILIEGRKETEDLALTEVDRLLKILLEHLSPSHAAKVVARYSGLPKQSIYQRALAFNENETGAIEDS